jgi:tetratricopeptide (TPR) repeat protein
MAIAATATADTTVPPSESENSAASSLRTAFQALGRKDLNAADSAFSAALDDPAFARLDENTRHTALASAAQTMLQAGKPAKAQQFARAATQMPEQDLDDWAVRLSAGGRLQDTADEVTSVTAIYRQWGTNSAVLPDETVFRVFRQSLNPEFSAGRRQMLETLYERRWHPADDAAAGPLWHELTRLLLEANEPDRAAEVAVLIKDPDAVIAMRADARFRRVLKAPFVRSDAERLARERIDALRQATAQHPGSLQYLRDLLASMARYRMDSEVLTVTDQVDHRIQAAGTSAYDDTAKNFAWILDIRARALRHLGRYQEAVDILRRVADLPDRTDKVSHAVNLAALLCELDLPEEALKFLPPLDQASTYGKMQIASIRFSAALELGRANDAAEALAYLREHRAESPETLQRALLRAGELDEAEQWLLSRLSDPEMRSSALVEMQRYFEPPLPPRAAQWRASRLSLINRAAIRAAVSQLGRIDDYSWRLDTFN